MNRKIVFLTFVSVLLLSTMFGALWLSEPITSASPSTWTVDDHKEECPKADFTTIQEAINNAKAGDTIEVYPGIYFESLIIDKSISLIGVYGSHVTTIDAGHTKEFQVVTIKSPKVKIENFSIQHTWKDIDQPIYGAGIRLQSPTATGLLYEIVIHKNVISNVYIGIDSGYYSPDIDLHNSRITENNITKIWVEGIHLSDGSLVFVRRNNFEDVGKCAISMKDVDTVEIFQNNIRDTEVGLKLEKGNGNNITDNTFTEIETWGIKVGGSNNYINDNNVTGPRGIQMIGNFSKMCNNTVKGESGIFGFHVMGVYNNIDSNTITDSWEYGIWSWKASSNFTNNVTNNTIQNANTGIYDVGYSSGNELRDCAIGIHIRSNGDVTMFNNSFYKCELGVRVEGNSSNINSNSFNECELGVRVEGNSSNINSNVFVSNYVTNGLALYGCFYSTIARNLFLHSNCSIYLHSASFNNVTENTISSSVWFIDSYNSQQNRLWYNDVFNVTGPLPCCEEVGTNEYQRNYWSAYSGADKDGDGVGNTPYLVAAIQNCDNYPLDVPYGSFPIFWEDEKHDCRILGNLVVSDICFNHSASCMKFNITVPYATELPSCCSNFTIPRLILDGHFQVRVDDTPIPSILSWNDTHTSIYFAYGKKGIHNVKVIAEVVTKAKIAECPDINGDGVISILDVAAVARRFAELKGGPCSEKTSD